MRIFLCWSWILIALAYTLIALAYTLIALAHTLIALANTLIALTHLNSTEKLHLLHLTKQELLIFSYTMNNLKKPGFNLYQSRHCTFIKTWFLKILSVSNKALKFLLKHRKTFSDRTIKKTCVWLLLAIFCFNHIAPSPFPDICGPIDVILVKT